MEEKPSCVHPINAADKMIRALLKKLREKKCIFSSVEK